MSQKNNFCHPVTLELFSIQLLVNSEIFSLSLNLSLMHLRLQSTCYQLKGDSSPVMLKELGSLSNGDGNENGQKSIGLGPVHTYPYSFEKATFFLRFPQKFASTRSVFASFSPVHAYTMNLFENHDLPDCGCLTHTCSLT